MMRDACTTITSSCLRCMIFEVTAASGMSDADLGLILPDYDAVVVRSANRVTRGMISSGPRLAVVGRAGSGVDNIDLEAASEYGVPVVNAPAGNARSVAGQGSQEGRSQHDSAAF